MKHFLCFMFIFNSLFSSEWINKLENNHPQTIVAYGTSLTNWHLADELRDLLQSKYPGLVNFINSGMPGACSKEGIDYLQDYVTDYNPDAVFIEFAINDAYVQYAIPLEMSRMLLNQMIDGILSHNANCEIILMTMNIPLKEHVLFRPAIERYYQIYREVARERNLLLIDHYSTWKKILDNDPHLYDRYVPDGLHPSAEGCRKVILPAIIEALIKDL